MDSGRYHILCWFNRPWGCYQGFIYSTWVDHGVLKEDPENTFILLGEAEEGGPGDGREVRVLHS